MRRHLGILLMIVLVVTKLVGVATAQGKPDPVYCRCDCIEGVMYKCCPDPVTGYVICERGCGHLQRGCDEPPF
jgi:hypothetical protein